MTVFPYIRTISVTINDEMTGLAHFRAISVNINEEISIFFSVFIAILGNFNDK
jgi:hypothetical protein